MTQEIAFEFADLALKPGERAITQLPVTRLLTGQNLSLSVHVVQGVESGPVVGITSAVHGAEFMPVRIVKEALKSLDPSRLRGTVIAIPVCNPISFARGTRVTPDEDDIDFANLNRVFPGRRDKALFGVGAPPSSDRTLTEAMAAVITEEFLPHVHHLMDFHAHMRNSGLIKTIQHKDEPGEQGEYTRGMCRAFGLGLIHEHAATPRSLTFQAAERQISSCIPEIGGGSLSLQAEARCVELGVRGIMNVLKFLGLLEGELDLPPRQLVFEIAPHVRPSTAGYLVSNFDPDQLFLGEEAGIPVNEGEVLGTLFDPYTFEELETLRSPVDGILYITRRSGPVEAGAHAYAVADFQLSRWID